jgi:hypothetical protein
VGKCLFVHRLPQNLNYITELSGYQLLMKPVVYTVTETESMNQGQDTVTEDHSTMLAQPSSLEANMGGHG